MREEKYCKQTKLIVAEIKRMFVLDGDEKNFFLEKIDEILRGKKDEKKHRNFVTKI